MARPSSRTRTCNPLINVAISLFISVFTLQVIADEPAITVCAQGCTYSTINQAVQAASEGATIRVEGGEYRENEIQITKPLTLIGNQNPVIVGVKENQPIVVFKTQNVKISGFEIRDTGKSYTSEIAGIRVVESSQVKIENIFFKNTTYGVYLEKSENCEIRNNRFSSNGTDEVSAGNGIHVWTGSGHTIENNTIQGHRDGIYLEFAKDCKVIENHVTQNLRYGLHFMSSNHTLYRDNDFSLNGSGVAVMYSKQIEMIHNRFSRNTGAAAYGLLLKDIQDSRIENNEFKSNTVAIYMEGSNRSNFQKNRFENNGWALRIMSDCDSDTFTQNLFTGNTFEVSTNADRSFNTFTKNYWSHYEGYDLNHDDIGDVPHRPVSLSSVILERVDSSYILLNSLLFQILDSVERVLPQMIPEPLKDEAPLMRPEQTEIQP